MTDQELALEKKLAIVRIVGKNFPARALGTWAGRRRRVLPALGDAEFVVVYMHSRVDRGENFPGVGAVRAAYESLPVEVRGRLHAVLFVHPGLQSQLFLATFGRFLSSLGLYGKLRYVSREPFGVPVGVHAEGGAGCFC